MSSIAFYAVICVIAALVLYTQIQKITRKIDENGTLANNSPEAVRQISVQKYKDFCEIIKIKKGDAHPLLKRSSNFDCL